MVGKCAVLSKAVVMDGRCKIAFDKMAIGNIISFSPACFAQDERGDVDRIRSLL